MAHPVVTPEDVKKLDKPTTGFLCPLSANTYDIVFHSFEVKDYDTKSIIFKVGGDDARPPPDMDFGEDFDEDMVRTIKYDFNASFLRLPIISTSLEFSVGDNEVHDFCMIERHYFHDRLIKSYDFDFGFCIPNTTNTWDATYGMPPLDPELVSQIVAEPYATKSDSFYFAGGQLIMHNKAEYRYLDDGVASEAPARRESEGKRSEGKEADGFDYAADGKAAEEGAGGGKHDD